MSCTPIAGGCVCTDIGGLGALLRLVSSRLRTVEILREDWAWVPDPVDVRRTWELRAYSVCVQSLTQRALTYGAEDMALGLIQTACERLHIDWEEVAREDKSEVG